MCYLFDVHVGSGRKVLFTVNTPPRISGLKPLSRTLPETSPRPHGRGMIQIETPETKP
jgi:hypothetical protein